MNLKTSNGLLNIDSSELPSICGVPIKHLALAFLVLQNSGLALIMRCSMLTPGPRYLTSTAVVLSECLKLSVSILMYLRENSTTSRSDNQQLPSILESTDSNPSLRSLSPRRIASDIFGINSGYVKMLIPAALYTLQNNLQFIAASNLDAASFQVAYQGKILTTAFFAVALLRQKLSSRKWFALLILTLGVALAQLPSSTNSAAAAEEGSRIIGFMAVGSACLISGLAGVYFEKLLKNDSTTTSVWTRNIQLASSSVLIAGMGALIWDGAAIWRDGFFQAYNNLVLLTIAVQALGGLIIAMVMKYADNILKGFATSAAIIVSVVASVILFDFVVTKLFMCGAGLVVVATYLYGLPDASVRHMEAVLLSDGEQKDMFDEEKVDPSREKSNQIRSRSGSGNRNGTA
jgi:solute carrier family 35 (UDP-sugar transporter), member A1/2/3